MAWNRLRRFWQSYKWLIIFTAGLVILAVSALVLTCFMTISSDNKYVYGEADSLGERFSETPVGIVFGGGIKDNKPTPLLQERLDAGAKLLKDGTVRKLLLSGDNRFSYYDEPRAMRDYLVNQKHVNAHLIQVDNAGRSTYETCERAVKIFGLKKAVLISEDTHLPRAIYLCRSFGMEAYGYASTGWATDYVRGSQNLRELLARTKAIFNVYFYGENTILGPPIKV